MIYKKKGSIWISAILYFGLGLVVLTIILTAATPVINRLRDKNIVIQTKNVFQVLDSNIREVAREGPGAQRPITIDIRKGEFKVIQGSPADPVDPINLPADPINIQPQIAWSYDTKAILAEPCYLPGESEPQRGCTSVTEGNLEIIVRPGIEKGSWDTTLFVDYGTNIYIQYESPVNIITGASPLVIRNVGVTCGPDPSVSDPFKRPISSCPNSARPTVQIVQR